MTLTGNSALDGRYIPLTGGSRLFAAGNDSSFRAHTVTYGALDVPSIGPELIDEIEKAGLLGRGGAGFPAARKLAAGRRAREESGWGSATVLIANGAEGEPRSKKDETLLRSSPHLVIDGALAAARAIGAKKIYLYTTARSLPSVEKARGERSDARSITLVEAAESFISGEASAVVNAIENGVAVPTDHTVRLTTSGLRKKPTVLHNVETLAHVGLIARYGSAWFRSTGTVDDPGTRLVTVSGAPVTERVLEVPGGARISSILKACGADESTIGAVLVGGYHGAWVPGDKAGTRLSARELAPFDAQPGAGIVIGLGKDECGLRFTADVVRYLASESAKQCGPCMFGLPKISSILDEIVWGPSTPQTRTRLRELSESVAGRGSCHHPDGTTRLVLNALTTFSADADAHLHGHCLSHPHRGMA